MVKKKKKIKKKNKQVYLCGLLNTDPFPSVQLMNLWLVCVTSN